MMFAPNANAKQQAIFSDAHYLTPSRLEIVQRHWRMLITHEFDWKRDSLYTGKGEEIGIYLYICWHQKKSLET